MRLIKYFEEFEARNVYNIDRKNRFNVIKGPYTGNWDVEYNTKRGKGKASVFTNESQFKGKFVDVSKMMDNELFLFGIETTPSNVGIGREFLKDIFEYFSVDRIYFYSLLTHPVWNKIATKRKDDGVYASFTLTKDQLK